MDARRQVELPQRAKCLSCAQSWRCQRCLALAGNIEDDSLETLVPSLRSIPLSFQFLMKSPVFIHRGRKRKAFSPVASLSGKLRKSLCSQLEGHKCFCTEATWCRGFVQKHPQVPACFCCFHRQDKHQALGKAALCIHSWCSTRGELQRWFS